MNESVVIGLSLLRDVSVNVTKWTATVQSGATIGDTWDTSITQVSVEWFSQVLVWYFDFGKGSLAILDLSYSILIVALPYFDDFVF